MTVDQADPGEEEARVLMGDRLMRALIDARIISAFATHVVIDIRWRRSVIIHEENLGDDRLLEVLPGGLVGAEIVRETPRAGDAAAEP